jgi:AmiR/NasT family two-component response regulator
MTRVLLGDFGAVVRLGFEEALQSAGFQLVEASAEDLTGSVMAVLPDVVMIDLDRPDASDLAMQVVTSFPSVKVIACSSVEPTMRIFMPFHGGESYVVELGVAELADALRS